MGQQTRLQSLELIHAEHAAMIVRLIPYAEISISVTMSLDEAAALTDALSLLQAKGPVAVAAEELRTELERAMKRATELQTTRGY